MSRSKSLVSSRWNFSFSIFKWTIRYVLTTGGFKRRGLLPTVVDWTNLLCRIWTYFIFRSNFKEEYGFSKLKHANNYHRGMNQKVHINCRRVYQSRPIFLKQSWIISDLIAEKVVSVPKKRFTECSPSALARLGNMPRKIILYGHYF